MAANQNRTSLQRMRELIDLLGAADIAYYRDDNPSMTELLELCRKAESGELRYLLQAHKKNGSKDPIYQCLGGTSAEKLAKIGRSRPDGMSLSRTAQLFRYSV